VKRPDRKGEQGSSLFEVTLALGLIGTVLGSIAGLFVIGAGGVKSGRNSSEALAIARSMIEDMQSQPPQQVYSHYGCDGTLSSCVANSTDSSELAGWQTLLDETLTGAHVTVAVSSLEPTPLPLSDSAQVRVMVTIHWQEGSRARKMRLGTVRM
jgi:Tfp pilus assembly protein PilV